MATFSQAFMGMPGGLNKVKNLKDVEPYTSLIEKHYNEQSKDNNYGIVAKIESAESQGMVFCLFWIFVFILMGLKFNHSI